MKRPLLALLTAAVAAGMGVTSTLVNTPPGCQGVAVATLQGAQDAEGAAEYLGGCDGAVVPPAFSWGETGPPPK